MNELYANLKNYINEIPLSNTIADKTKSEYLKEYTRMYINNSTPETQAKRKSSYYKYRASWLYANTVLANIKIDEIEVENDIFIKDRLIASLNNIVDRIKKYPPINTVGLSIHYEKDALQKSNSKSKKGQVITLKKTWSTLMLDHMKAKESKYLIATCVLFCSGCRPSEAMNGVEISKSTDGLTVKIAGTKTHEGKKYGQESRKFTVNIDDPHYHHLINLPEIQQGFTLNIKIDSAKLLGEQIRRNSKIVLPNEKSYISPYTYRHNFSRMLKNIGLSHDDIAMSLGHCTDKSQNYYAHASNKGSSCFKITNITASKKIKRVVNNDYINTATLLAPAFK